MMEQLEIKQTLGDVGVDYDKGLERFMGNVALYHKFLVKFLVTVHCFFLINQMHYQLFVRFHLI